MVLGKGESIECCVCRDGRLTPDAIIGESNVEIAWRGIEITSGYATLRFLESAIGNVVIGTILWKQREVPQRYSLQEINRASFL
jgi:hypothetical protein